MHIEKEVIFPNKVEIARQALTESEAEGLTEELELMFSSWDEVNGIFPGDKERTLLVGNPGQLKYFADMIGPILRDVINIVNIPEEAFFGFNKYFPKAYSNIHPDRSKNSIVVHGNGNSLFEFAPHARKVKEAERNLLSLEVNSGDIVFFDGRLLHRGNNTGDIAKINVAFSFGESRSLGQKIV